MPDHNDPLRTVRDEADALLSRLSATVSSIADADRLASLRDDLSSALVRSSSSVAAAHAVESSASPASITSLGGELLVRAFNYLGWEDVLIGRAVCISWRDEARLSSPNVRTMIRHTGSGMLFSLMSLRQLLPRIENMRLYCYDEIGTIRPVTDFAHLRSLCLDDVRLEGSHPYLFQMPNLEVLDIGSKEDLEWDLDMVSGLPRLKELRCHRNYRLTGSLRSLCRLSGTLTHLELLSCDRVVGTLKDIGALRSTLVDLELRGCERVSGSLNDLRRFCHLKYFDLLGTDVRADVSEVRAGDFAALNWHLNGKMLRALVKLGSAAASSRGFTLNSITRLDARGPETGCYVDLDLVSIFPNLREVHSDFVCTFKGGLSNLRVLSNVLREVYLLGCKGVVGPLSILRDCIHLKKLELKGTNVVADVENIGPNDFPSLTDFSGIGHPFRVKDAPAFMSLLHEKRSYESRYLQCLHPSSLDFYIPNLQDLPAGDRRERLECHPFKLEFVKVGPRMGWRWSAASKGYYFETNWFDPTPLPSDEGYETYCDNVEIVTKKNLGPFRGMNIPPATEKEYKDVATAYIAMKESCSQLSAVEVDSFQPQTSCNVG